VLNTILRYPPPSSLAIPPSALLPHFNYVEGQTVGVGGTVDTHTYSHTPTSRGGVGRTRQDIWRNSRST